MRAWSIRPATTTISVPGSHVQQGVQTGVALITAQLNSVLLPGQRTMVLLETMAGEGSEVGRTFEELRSISGRRCA